VRFPATPVFRDVTRFAIFLVLWQGLVSAGYGQQLDSFPPLISAQRIAQKSAPPPANGGVPPLTALTASSAGTLANPLAQTLSNVALASVPAKTGAKQSKPRLLAPAPITTIADPADGTDPYIIAEAQALGNSATQIFAFVRDQVGFDVYAGSLRGARGTLWTNAGNSLDRGSLLIALLRAAGFTARYVQGSLTGGQATQILQQIFANPPLGVLGCIPGGTTLANPVSDPTLISTLEQHFWVQYASGPGPFQNADPSFPGSTLGQVFGTPQSTFTTVPANLQDTVSIELDAEIYNSAEALFGGNGLGTTPVLNVTLATSETVGRPLALGHFVSNSSVSEILSAQTNTYTPYLAYGNTTDPSQDETIVGTQYQEEFTNFPLGTTVVTGVFLTFQVTDSNGNTRTYNKTLFDRIGYAARENGTTLSISVASSSQPSISPLDIATINISASLQAGSQITSYATTATSLQSQLPALMAQTTTLGSPPTPAQMVSIEAQQQIGIEETMVTGRMMGAAFARLSDQVDVANASATYVRAYFNSPRLIVVTNHVSNNVASGQTTTSITQELDLVKDDKYSIPLPNQNASASISYNILRGIMESVNESQIYQLLTQNYTPQGGVALVTGGSVADIFSAAHAQGIGTILLTSANAGLLNTLPISADAKARISDALSANLVVVAPSAPVALNAANQFGWFQFDPATGLTESVGEDGAHQSIIEYVGVLLNGETDVLLQVSPTVQFILGFVFGILWSAINFLTQSQLKRNYGEGATLGNSILTTVDNVGAILGAAFSEFPFFSLGFAAAFLVAKTWGEVDPETPGILTAIPVPAAGSPGSSAGVTAQLSADPLLTLPFSGAELPLVYRVQIQNTGPSADTFNLTTASVPAGFTIQTSLPSMTIPAGATAIIGVCAVPSTPIPAPGTPESFQLNVTSATNPSITTSATENFNVPAVQGLTLSLAPIQIAVTPGSNVNATLTVQAAGNTAVTAALSISASTPLSLNGVPSSISLNPGQTQSIPVTIGVPSGTPVGSQNVIQIAATISAGVTPTQTGAIVNVVAQQAQAALIGATDAIALGRTDIAIVLSNLSAAINTAVSSCSPAAQQLVVDYVNNLIQLMNAPYLVNFVSQLQTASAAISAATCSNLPAALTQLSNLLASLAAVLSSPSAFPFNLALQPNSAVAQPTQAFNFLIVLQNNSTSTNTYTLSLGTLPGGVSGSLSTTSVTLAPGASIPVNNAINNPTVTITPSASTAFQFSLNASINGVSGSTQTAPGTMTARSTFLAVQDVTATPGFTNAGGSVDVTTDIANVVNQNKTVQVTFVVNNSSSVRVLGPFSQTVALSVTSLLTTVDFGQINTTGLVNGNYTLAVSVIDPVTNMVMPGGTGTGSLLIGSPVTATLTVSPQTVAPGNATVTSTLSVAATGSGTSSTPLSLLGSVTTASGAVSVAVNGNIAYTCDPNEISVINVANPANPVVTGTAIAGAISNADDIYCDIQRNDLVMLVDADSTLTGNNPSFLAFDLTNPASPSLIASTVVEKRFFGPPYYEGNTAFFFTNEINLNGSSIVGQAGDFISLDVTSFSSPAVLGTVETQTQGPVYGGSFNVFGATPYNTQIGYAASTTSQGGNTQIGVGQLWAVNTANPSAMSILAAVNVPGTIQLFTPLVQGNTAVAIGDTGGWANPCCGTDAFTGNVVAAVFDLTNPQSPQLVANVPTTYLPSPSVGRGAVVIGPHLFLYSGVMDSGNNQYFMLIDTTIPQSPVITTYQIPTEINYMRAVGTLLYAPTSSGLQIYSIPGVGAIQYTAAVQIANNANAAYNANSFSVAPTSVTPGSGADTVTWVNPASNTITWTSNVTGIQAGQVLPIDLGGTVNFTVTAGSGTVTLPQVDVNSGQILGLAPGTQTVAPGQLAAYTLTVNNPTSSPITYNLAVTGISQTWVALQSSVTVPASGSMPIPLNLRSTLADIANTYNFTVTATSGGTSGSVQGTMILTGTGTIGATGSSNTLGVQAALIPTQATGGQGTPTTFAVQLTNVGNVADTYTLSATTPASITATFSQPTIAVPPGLSNFRQVLVQVTAAQGTAVGSQNFTITATSQTNTQILAAATGTLNVVAMGVALSFSPASVNPSGTLHLTVTNLGSVTDTFALALGGPAAVISSLAANSVTLGPNQSQQVSVAVGAAPFAVLGSLGLVATATGGVTGAATATVVIPSSQGISAAFNPTRTALSAPGPATLLLQIQNTGTIQDSYVATIVSTSGPITASLVDPVTGQSVQTTSVFILPGTAQGQLVVNATLTGITDGSVTVKITSQTNAAITATGVGVLGIGTSIPVAIAGKNRNVPTGLYTSLDGGQSYDPDENRLTYAWTLVRTPPGSALGTLNNAGIGNASTPQPFFLPDVNGAYTLQLIVNNGSVSSAPSMVQITAFTGSIPPNANAGVAQNALKESPVLLKGTASNDPSQTGLALTYSWTVQSAPVGSALVSGSQISGNTPMPSFTPDVDGAFVIVLQVSDTAGSSMDTVTITAFNVPVPPNAVAGANRRVVLNTPITVDGSGSNDPGNSQSLTYQWSFVSGSLSDVALLNATGAQVAFAPAAPGFYVLRLDASNGTTSSFGETTVMAAKYCDANADGLINQADFDLMTALLGSAAQPNDPLDPGGFGVITSADILICKGQTAPAGLPNLYVTPTYLVFQYTIGGPLPAAQSLQITADANTSFTIPNPSFTWINLSSQARSTPAGVSVSINPAGLVPGPYLAQLIPVANGFNSPAPVRIELTVLAAPQFLITPNALTFKYQSGGPAPPPQTVELQASGQNTSFSAEVSGATWLSVNPSSGMTPKPLAIAAAPAPSMAPGTYTGVITFSSSSSSSSPAAASQSMTVTLIVMAAPPAVTASGIVNAASNLGGPVAPGEIVFVGGTGFAAAGTNLTPPNGPVPVELGNTQIFFDNTPAPLLLVQPGLLKAIVPYEVAGQTTTLVRVIYSSVPSPVVTLPVALSNPGIFTQNTTGTGQVLAVNADSTLNSSTNPAARGSTLTFYETGEGQTIPTGVDGSIASEVPTTAGGKAPPVPAQKVSVMIGGQPAVVTYAGGAPGFPAGLMQVNVVIPNNAPTGGSTPVLIIVGASQSQAAAAISVN
jgi:uncharacterized membrane protein